MFYREAFVSSYWISAIVSNDLLFKYNTIAKEMPQVEDFPNLISEKSTLDIFSLICRESSLTEIRNLVAVAALNTNLNVFAEILRLANVIDLGYYQRDDYRKDSYSLYTGHYPVWLMAGQKGDRCVFTNETNWKTDLFIRGHRDFSLKGLLTI